ALVACQGAPQSPSSPPSTLSKVVAVLQSRVLNSGRVARPIDDPARGSTKKIASYWTLEPAEPFEIVDAVITNNTTDPGAKELMDMTVRVMLPSQQGVSQAYRLFRMVQGGTETPLPELGELPTDVADDAADLADDVADPDEAAPTIDPAADDDPDDEPDYLVDADDDDLWEAGEGTPYVDPMPKEMKSKILAKGHQVNLHYEDFPVMGDAADRCLIEDQTSGNQLVVEFNQMHDQLTLHNHAGTLTFRLNPDDTMLVNGQVASNARAAARLMAADKVVKATSTHMLAVIFARRARSPLPATRGKYPCNTDDTRFSGDQSNRSLDGTAGNGYRLIAGVPTQVAFQDPVADMLRVLIQGRLGATTIQSLERLAKPASPP
ncbi:MAG TPA: hypothetical protein V6D05_10700, partial [Stenomitos sp.]